MAKRETKTSRFGNWWNYDPDKSYKTICSGTCLTIPERSTLKNIVENYTESMLLSQQEMLFLGDHEIPDLHRMDRLEAIDYSAELRLEVARRQKEFEELQNEKGEEAKIEDIPSYGKSKVEAPPPPDQAE